MTEAPADQPFSVLGLNHIAIAVPDLEAAAEMYRTVFGASVSHPKVNMLKTSSPPFLAPYFPSLQPPFLPCNLFHHGVQS